MDPTRRDTTKNPILQVIKERHSIRMFTDEPIPEETLRMVLEAANLAPSAHNQQSWRFIIVTGEKKREMADLIASRATELPKSASVLLRMASRTIASAPVVIAIVNTGDLIEHGMKLFGLENTQGYDFFRTMEIQSSAAAVENLLLAATSLGLATVWLGILFLVKDEVLQLLGEPKGEFMAVIPIGKPVRDSRGPEKRPLEAIIKYLG